MATQSKAKPTAKNRSGMPNGVAPELLLHVVDSLAELRTLDEQLKRLLEIINEQTGAERGTLFLHDAESSELYSRASLGDKIPEIRVSDTAGVIGKVFTSGEGVLIANAYADENFNSAVDEMTGYKTRNIICAPIRTRCGSALGVAQALNKTKGRFTKADLELLEVIALQASTVLQGSLSVSQMLESQQREAEFLDMVAKISSEIQLGPLLIMIMSMITGMLNAERATLFINDDKTNELYTETSAGAVGKRERIRFPNDKGIAGTVFQTGESVTIPYAYADLRFNPAFDKKTGFFTRSLLCVPLANKQGKRIGVTQVLNKIGGTFTKDDQVRLKAFTAQITIALENAKLFDDIQSIKQYNEGILESMSNGLVTFGDEKQIVTCNQAGLSILNVEADQIIGKSAQEFFGDDNSWLVDNIERVATEHESIVTMDAEIALESSDKKSVNVNVSPLTGGKGEHLGSMVLLEDISTEKRMKSTMSRYMDPALAETVLQAGGDILGGTLSEATVLFSDIRGFTTLTEELGAKGTVTMLNEYFTVMIECITEEGGILDKFIGDAIMAVFGTPIVHDDDPDRGLRCAIKMMTDLAAFNVVRKERGLKAIDIGIGLNTDQVVSGNIGSPKRQEYTAIGDGVNLAARLESACKQYGAHLLISEFTIKQLKGTYRTREIDTVVVKGKTEPVLVHEVLDYHTDETFPSMTDVTNYFRDGIREYRGGNWDKATSSFEEALQLHPNDKASKMYIERCEFLKENPPEGEWTGVWVMTSK
jgi:adenylate cyclase